MESRLPIVDDFGNRYPRCTRAWTREDAADEQALLADHARYRVEQILPYAGGWHDQPAKFTAAVPIIDRAITEAKQKIADAKKRAQEVNNTSRGSLGGLL